MVMLDFLKSLPDDISIPYLSFKLIDKFFQTSRVLFPTKKCIDHEIRILFSRRLYTVKTVLLNDGFQSEKVVGYLFESSKNDKSTEKIIKIPLLETNCILSCDGNATFGIQERSIVDDFYQEIESFYKMKDPVSLVLSIGRDPLKFSEYRQNNSLDDLKEFLFTKVECINS